MKSKNTQVDKILNRLKAGKSVTAAQASAMGIKNIRARITDIRQLGYEISVDSYKLRGRTFSRYTMVD